MRPRRRPSVPTKVPLPSSGFAGVEESPAMRRTYSPPRVIRRVKWRATSTQLSPRGFAPQLESPRPREAAARGVLVGTLRVAADRERSMAKPIGPALPTGELRSPLLQERARALGVIVAVIRLDAHLEELLPVDLAHALEDGLHLRLGAAYRQRGIVGHGVEVVVGARLQGVRGHEALDEADAEGLRGLEGARRVEDVLGVGGAHQLDELMHGIEAV